MKESKYNLLFKIKGANYLFNTFNQSLVEITNEISESFESNSLLEVENENLKILKEKGFVIEDEFNELDNYLNLYEKEKKENSLYAKLLLSSGCNFGCTYCYQAHNETKMNVISLNKIEIFLLWIENQIIKHKFDSIIFEIFGGEPTLAIKHIPFLLQSISKISDNYNVPIKKTITTNASLLDDDTIKLLIEHEVEMQITIDGTKELHNKRRMFKNKKDSGSFDLIIEKVKKIVLYGGTEFLKIRMNVDKQNIENIDSLANYLHSIGVKHFYCGRVTFRGKKTSYDDLVISKEDFDINFDFEIFNILNKYGYCDSPGELELAKPCQVQKQFAYNFSPNLEIAKCDELLDNDEFKIGYLNEKGELIYTNDNYQKQIEMSPGNNETCRKCKLLPMCASGGCPVETLNLKDTIYSYSCTAVNYKSIEKKIENILNVMNTEIVNEV